jgi:aromatic-L-amino-acid/L-tryptophan decarboxylase
MNSGQPMIEEESLDPQDWEAMRALGHRMVDDMLNALQSVRERPVWHTVPSEAKAHLQAPLPQEGQGAEQAYEDFLQHVLPHPMGNIHPRFWGWVIGTGTPFGMLAEMLAAGMNPNVGGGDHVANFVEAQVLDWLKQAVGYPSEASGLLVSGGSMANMVGLTVARNARAGFDVRKFGLDGGFRQLVLYCSTETHSSVQRAVEVLGLGSDALRKIPVNDAFQIDIDALEAAIAADHASEKQLFCIVGNAGTVNTGAFDDLNRLADICARENLWYHVDGAFGALAALSPSLSPLVAGMERADSLAFDLHKWLHVPYEAGCALVRSSADHFHAFTLTPDYLAHSKRGAAGGSLWFSDYGIELSRGFKALKVWISLKEHGIEKYGRLIQQNVDQARYLAALVEAAPELELLAPVSLQLVCFRYRADGLDDAALNALNEELLLQLQESGIAVPSGTLIRGHYAIRVSITNHRTRREDLDLFVQELRRIGQTLLTKSIS